MTPGADELDRWDATETAHRVKRGELTPLEAVDAAIARIEKRNPALGAVITPLFESARRAAQGTLPDGPFRGVPFLLKDLDALSAGDPFHGGMQFLKRHDYRAETTSHLVERFRGAGLVVLGKTNTPELGLQVTTEPRAYGPARNPWNPDHSTGGSSGGSAAAVASGMVPAAHASDGGGSIRIPASECGLVGLKPSRGRVSQGPEHGEYWHGLVTSHVVTRTVRDSAGLLDVVQGEFPGDPYTAPPPARAYSAEPGSDPGRLRIGLMPDPPAGGLACHAECRAAVEATGRRLEALGHHVELAHPGALDEHAALLGQFSILLACWTAKALAHWGRAVGVAVAEGDVEPDTWLLAQQGAQLKAADYLEAVEGLHAWSRRVVGWWAGGWDLLVTPTLAGLPPRIGELAGEGEAPGVATQKAFGLIPFTAQFNVTGQPAISLPLNWSSTGLPIGLQFVAAPYREDQLIRVAAQLEAAHPWADRIPPLAS